MRRLESSSMPARGSRLSVKNTFLTVAEESSEDELTTGWPRGITAPARLEEPAYVHVDSLLVSTEVKGMSRPVGTMTSGAPGLVGQVGDPVQSAQLASATHFKVLLEAVAETCGAWATAGDSTTNPEASKQTTLAAISNMLVSVTLADPSLPDCPVIGCSDGFEELTGYSRREIIGQNCRFLSRGISMDPVVRSTLRDATLNGSEFLGVLPNVRKNGERFANLLHMTTLSIRDNQYIVGIQADASNVFLDLKSCGHKEVLEAVAQKIFTGHLNAWIVLQARDFYMRLPAPYSQMLKLGFPQRFVEEQGRFVRLGGPLKAAQQGSESQMKKKKSASFSDVCSECPSTIAGATLDDGNSQASTASQCQAHPLPATLPSGNEVPAVTCSATQPQAPPKSVGSAMHPDGCTECTFFFFSALGCKSGANCGFCHEFHPRKNEKKNRRIIRAISTRAYGDEELSQKVAAEQLALAAEQLASGTSTGSNALDLAKKSINNALGMSPELQVAVTCNSLRPDAPEATGLSATASKCQVGNASSAAVDRSTCLEPGRGHEDVLRFSYGIAEYDRLAPLPITLVAGVRAHLGAQLAFVTAEAQQSIGPYLSFVVQPALPKGLSLDARTGLISGIPKDLRPQEGAVACIVTAKVAAQGCGGIALGDVPLASCTLVMTVVALQHLTICGTDPTTGAPLCVISA